MSEVRALLAAAAARLGGEAGRLEAELLLAHALDRSRAWLYAHATDVIAAEVHAAFNILFARRAAGEPIAYLLGEREFWNFTLALTSATLIPRSETERLVELALERLPRGVTLDVVDLGTGSGAVALALARERPDVRVLATDASEAALEVAKRNATRLRITNMHFALGDWYAAIDPARFAMIVSNPPYLAENDVHLGRGDLRFEPRSALISGADGLDAIRRIVAGAPARLASRGWLLIEHGFTQGDAVRALFGAAGFADIVTAADLEGRDRVTLGQRVEIADRR